MRQVMAIKSKNALIQDIKFSNKKFMTISSAMLAKCDVCGREIESGFSVTAKSVQNDTMFFCKAHLI